MSNQSTTSISQDDQATTGGTTPFMQITELEQKEQKRVEVELASFITEEATTEQSLQEKEVALEQEMKDEAMEELKKYREAELSPIVKSAEQDATNSVSGMNTAYENNKSTVQSMLLTKLTDSSLI